MGLGVYPSIFRMREKSGVVNCDTAVKTARSYGDFAVAIDIFTMAMDAVRD
jgi:hypothetical protein